MNKPKKVYGPYKLNNGREIVVLYYSDGATTSKSYPKYLVEKRLGRELKPNETVDHKDGDFYNNDEDNLQVLTRSDHIRQDTLRSDLVETVCVWCGRKRKYKAAHLRDRAKKGKAGPFCSRECSLEYAKAIKRGEIKPFPPQEGPDSTYYKIKDLHRGQKN